ncbi:MAG: vitamin K epoxide reductase family protein [Actinobacteria bacterium]|nr:vitamin K epoxide reductase family protein [Actinomycetota bacterium]
MLALTALGLCIAGYLAYVETTQSVALCGPVGDCNAVQQSTYARLFGVLPVAYVGMVGYLLIGVAFGISRLASTTAAKAAARALFLLTLCGTLFSIYLTALEPFAIGATCAWCLSSAVIVTLLLLLSANGVRLKRQRNAVNPPSDVADAWPPRA